VLAVSLSMDPVDSSMGAWSHLRYCADWNRFCGILGFGCLQVCLPDYDYQVSVLMYSSAATWQFASSIISIG
jgi:hypothetical protein